MTQAIHQTEQKQGTDSLREINIRRWGSYAGRLSKHIGDDKLAYRALMILMGSINANKRWMRITKDEFLSFVPDWTESSGETDWELFQNNETVNLHIYLDRKTGKYYFSRLVRRGVDVSVLEGWHVAALNGIRSRKIPMSKGLNDELYKIGQSIVKSIREDEGVWRKVKHPMLKQDQVTGEI